MPTKVRTKDARFELRVRTSQLVNWRTAAQSQGLSLARWIEEACDAEAAGVVEAYEKEVQAERLSQLAISTPGLTRTYGLQAAVAQAQEHGPIVRGSQVKRKCIHKVPLDQVCKACPSLQDRRLAV